MYLLYSVLLFLYFLAVLPAAAFGARRRGREPGSLRERFGRLPDAVNPDRRPSIWVHAVSVGEALAARPLLRELRGAYPAHRLIVSTTTATGQRVARGFGRDVDAVCYAPFDFPPFVVRALDRIAPELFLAVDTEIWPNLLRACRRRGVGAMIVNGRLSDRSFRRYRLARGCMRRVLADVGRICAQTEGWGRRFVALGADRRRVTVTGSLKFDAAGGPPARAEAAPGAAGVPPAGSPPAPRAAAAGAVAAAGEYRVPPAGSPPAPRAAGRPPAGSRRGSDAAGGASGHGEGERRPPAGSRRGSDAGDPLRAAFDFARSRPVLIAASTLRGEEEPVLRAFDRVRRTAPGALLVIAPRRPERFEEARAAAARAGRRVRMRSDLEPGRDPGADVVILDTLGELGRLFDAASVVFVGGSLVPAGGHNLIEPAAFGRAIVFGPHMENFADVAREFVARGAAVQVRDAAELEETLAGLMRDGARRARLGAAARALVDANRGAARRTLDAAAELLPPAAGARGAPAREPRGEEAPAC